MSNKRKRKGLSGREVARRDQQSRVGRDREYLCDGEGGLLDAIPTRVGGVRGFILKRVTGNDS